MGGLCLLHHAAGEGGTADLPLPSPVGCQRDPFRDGDWLKKDIKKYGLQLEPDYRAWDNPVGGSDNGTFAKAGIPIIWYHTDGHPDYHQPSDHADRLNWDKIVEITKASFLNMWKMANEASW